VVKWGLFYGRVVTEWLPSRREDRRMKLHPDTTLCFVRQSGEIIRAQIGLEFDGASIPPVFWLLFGSPFTGKYRNAAVIHDTLCFRKDRPWREAHRIFYECARALGVGRLRSTLMYQALMLKGSRW
jgi:endonuclease G